MLVYAFLVGKVARATLLETLHQTISSSLQMVSLVSGAPATEFIGLHSIEMLSELRLVYHGAPGASSVGCLDAAASNHRSSSPCNAPLKRVA
jgi:hypothetical protein